MDKARETWASKVDELAGRLVAARQTLHRRSGDGAQGGGGGGGIGVFTSEGEGAPLLLLARMFAQEQAAIEELEEMWNRDPKWTEFFLPQVLLTRVLERFGGVCMLAGSIEDRIAGCLAGAPSFPCSHSRLRTDFKFNYVVPHLVLRILAMTLIRRCWAYTTPMCMLSSTEVYTSPPAAFSRLPQATRLGVRCVSHHIGYVPGCTLPPSCVRCPPI